MQCLHKQPRSVRCAAQRGTFRSHLRPEACPCSRRALAYPRQRAEATRCPAQRNESGASFSSDDSMLSAQRRLLQHTRVLKKEPQPHDDDIVQMNVGGVLLHTFRSTLLQFPGSRLAAMFAKSNEGSLQRDKAGNVFLDYDPHAFVPLLQYLREVANVEGGAGSVPLPYVRLEHKHAFDSLAFHLRVGPAFMAQADESGSTTLEQWSHEDRFEEEVLQERLLASSGKKSSQLLLRRPHAHPSLPSAPRSSHGSSGQGAPSRLFWVHSQQEGCSGTKLSVYTEKDLQSGSRTFGPGETCDLFCDATWGEPRLSLTVVQRADNDDLFVGVTSKSQVDQKGLQIPCYGWKRHGWCYNGSSVSCDGSSSSSSGSSNFGSGAAGMRQLWQKGDSVELVVELGAPAAQQGVEITNRLTLKVNGMAVDSMTGVPALRHWCWYLAVYDKGDVSCVVFELDAYTVCWGNYHVKRYLN